MSTDKQDDEARLRKLLGEDEEDTRTDLEKKADALVDRPLPDLRSEIAKLDDDFAARREALEARVNDATARKKSAARVQAQLSGGSGPDPKSLRLGISIVYAMMGTPLVFLGIGWVIDHFAGTSLMPISGGVGVLLAMIYVVASLMKANDDNSA